MYHPYSFRLIHPSPLNDHGCMNATPRWDNSDRTATATVGNHPHPVASAFLMVGNGGQFVDNGCLDPDPSGSCCARLHRRGLKLMLFSLIFTSGLAMQSAFDATLQWLLPR